ncbi:hypothetical protein G7Y89_g12580 [Cudoniella acicularis]|uniref:Uncharacterized protein n=1 Tax=Cudoniella acicularis TaxID=354080 RepID=A0A8H4RB54_9HELO|nr:hypothetical protein G7Y89_g12580 [Cudoniella acicularis]
MATVQDTVDCFPVPTPQTARRINRMCKCNEPCPSVVILRQQPQNPTPNARIYQIQRVCFGDTISYVRNDVLVDLMNKCLQLPSIRVLGQLASELNTTFHEHCDPQKQRRVTNENDNRDPTRRHEVFFFRLWTIILDIVEQLGPKNDFGTQDVLADFIRELSEIIVKTRVKIWGISFPLWESLPMFKRCIMKHAHYLTESRETSENRQRWHNLSAFLVKLTDYGIMDLSIYAIWAFRFALETRPNVTSTLLHQADYMDYHVPIAAMWIKKTGRKIYANCYAGDDFPDEEKPGGGGLWDGESGFSTDRWRFWKARFAEIGEFQSAHRRTRELAQHAVASMNWVGRDLHRVSTNGFNTFLG